METILTGDIGGTNCRLELYEVDRHCAKPLENGVRAPGESVLSKTYQNVNFLTFGDAVRQFFIDAKIPSEHPPLTACIACAGPVKDNEVTMTNHDHWVINGEEIKEMFGIRHVSIINDFVAQGYGLLGLQPEELIVLQDAPREDGAPIACIGAGTGLGECFLTMGPQGHYVCYPTEGGHAEFAPRSQLEMRLLSFLLKKFESKHRVSVERVVSGPGISNVYEFLTTEMPELMDPVLHAEIQAAGELQGKIIATNTGNDLCRHAMEIFAAAYGSEAGVAGLKWLPKGGLYITGGLTPKNIDLIRDPHGLFMTAFRDKGRVSHMLESIPVYACMVEDVGQRGAYREGYQEFYDLICSSVAPMPIDLDDSTKALEKE